ncbi:MAG: cation transporter [Ignavibacteriae bacterium]|nr:cation transporter [Ignavibacteriota bacterium]
MSHAHSHHHNHNKVPKNINSAFKIGIILNVGFVIVEFVYGIIHNSLALMADAGHNLSDVLGLLIAWGASYLVTKEPTKKYTYGFKRSSIMAATLNALLLLVAIGIILWEGIQRFSDPQEVDGIPIMIVAAIGVVINGVTAYLFLADKDKDLNVKGAYIHMFADTLISVGVVITGLLILLTDFNWIDSVVSIIIVVVIFWGTWGLLKDSLNLSLDAVPNSVQLEKVHKHLNNLENVITIHHLHIWALSTTENALTVHIVKEIFANNDELLKEISHELKHHFNISHTTIQIEDNKCDSEC